MIMLRVWFLILITSAQFLFLISRTYSDDYIDFGKYHALLIANKNYTHWKSLNTPIKDVTKIAAILEDKYDFRTEILLDATRDQIVDKLEEYKEWLTNRDNLLIYYAGHGKLREDGGYWIGIDGHKKRRTKWLHFSTINELISFDYGMKARHVMVISDSCYAGAMTLGDEPSPKRKPDESDQAWLLRIQTNYSRRALTSGGTEPVIDRAGNAVHSIFAQELIRQLEGNSSVLEARSLYELIKKDVHAKARRIIGDGAQAPVYDPIPGTGDSGGDFIFVLKGSDVRKPNIVKLAHWNFGVRGDVENENNLTNDLGMKFVYIPPGNFVRGSPENELERNTDEMQHQVILTNGFYMQTTEVTQGQYNAVILHNPSDFKKGGENCPVENVSWADVQKFIDKLNAKAGGQIYRLPTEAEWEYAARAGTSTTYYTGNTKSSLYRAAWCMENSNQQTHPVAQKEPNAFGLYDMHGNVWEWCQDWYEAYFSSKAVKNPEGPAKGPGRVVRGGGTIGGAEFSRAAIRSWEGPHIQRGFIGFRLALSFDQLPSQE